MRPGTAVWTAPAPFEVDVAVAAEAADDPAELAECATLLALLEAEEATLEALLSADDAVDPAPAETDEADAPAPLPKIVVLPIVLVKVEESEVSTLTMAEVVIAELEPEPEPVLEPDPPAPPTPKIVVDPMVLVMVDEPLVSTLTMAEVVIAEEDPPAPVEVSVTVEDGEVTRVVSVAVAADPVLDAALVEVPPPAAERPAEEQYACPKLMAWLATSEPQAWLEQSRIP